MFIINKYVQFVANMQHNFIYVQLCYGTESLQRNKIQFNTLSLNKILFYKLLLNRFTISFSFNIKQKLLFLF